MIKTSNKVNPNPTRFLKKPKNDNNGDSYIQPIRWLLLPKWAVSCQVKQCFYGVMWLNDTRNLVISVSAILLASRNNISSSNDM